jgi:hypothetical protein
MAKLDSEEKKPTKIAILHVHLGLLNVAFAGQIEASGQEASDAHRLGKSGRLVAVHDLNKWSLTCGRLGLVVGPLITLKADIYKQKNNQQSILLLLATFSYLFIFADSLTFVLLAGSSENVSRELGTTATIKVVELVLNHFVN